MDTFESLSLTTPQESAFSDAVRRSKFHIQYRHLDYSEAVQSSLIHPQGTIAHMVLTNRTEETHSSALVAGEQAGCFNMSKLAPDANV